MFGGIELAREPLDVNFKSSSGYGGIMSTLLLRSYTDSQTW